VPLLQIRERDENIMQPLAHTTPQPTPLKLDKYLALELKFYAAYWCGIFQFVLFTSGRDGGYALNLDGHRLPSLHFPRVTAKVRRSDPTPRKIETAESPPAIISRENRKLPRLGAG